MRGPGGIVVAILTGSLGGLISSHVNRDQSRPSLALETHREDSGPSLDPIVTKSNARAV